MPRTRIPANISFRTEEEKREAIAKAASYGHSLSEQIQIYFKRLRYRDREA